MPLLQFLLVLLLMPLLPLLCQVIVAIDAIIAIAATPAIAAIFSFNATFHQFTHLFCIAHIITDNEKNQFHATIHEQ